MKTRATAVIALAVALPFGAGAEEPASTDVLDAIAAVGPSSSVAVDRSWLYNDSARLPAAGHAIGLMRLSYGSGSPTRAFAGNLGTAGGMFEIGGEVGLFERVSAVAIGTQGQDSAGSSQTGGLFGLRVSLLPRSVRATQLVVSGGVLRELEGNGGAWGRLTLGHDEGPTRLAVSVHAEKIFETNRDTVDLMVTAGVSTRLVGPVRVGIEYVGQDLEGVVDAEEAEGGARHILGPVVSAALWNQRISLVGGPAVALGGPGETRVLGRVSLSCQF